MGGQLTMRQEWICSVGLGAKKHKIQGISKDDFDGIKWIVTNTQMTFKELKGKSNKGDMTRFGTLQSAL